MRAECCAQSTNCTVSEDLLAVNVGGTVERMESMKVGISRKNTAHIHSLITNLRVLIASVCYCGQEVLL